MQGRKLLGATIVINIKDRTDMDKIIEILEWDEVMKSWKTFVISTLPCYVTCFKPW